MYAIVNIAGQQYKVEKDQKLFVHRLEKKEGESVSFDEVLLIDNDKSVVIGEPTIKGAMISGKVISHPRGDKIKVFKKKRRKGYKVRTGHRQYLTEIQIEEIIEKGATRAAKPKASSTEGSKEPAPAKAASAAKKPAPAAPKTEAAKPAASGKAEPATAPKAEAAKPAAKPATKTAAKKPAAKKPASGAPASTGSSTGKTTARKAQAAKPAAKKPTAAKAAPKPASKPAAKKPAAKKPDAGEETKEK